jgi:hypothetical protein
MKVQNLNMPISLLEGPTIGKENEKANIEEVEQEDSVREEGKEINFCVMV